MNRFFNLKTFLPEVTGRKESFFNEDLEHNSQALQHGIEGKSVLVIGGAGTIGSFYIKALLKFKPARLYVVDINENGLTELVRDLRSSVEYFVPADFKTYPINFGDAIFEKILRREGPFEIVANFAAHKHVRSEKDAYSIEAMIENNVLKAGKLLDLLTEYPPEHFFCVSTDKAANPVNLMGASKKLMEHAILSYSERFPITTARFANVAFSNGSLLYGFIERMMKRQPLSSPSNVLRYFVSPEESGELCLLACMLGESGDIFFPKLDPTDMKNFADIAALFLKSCGFTPDICATEEIAKEKALRLTGVSTEYPIYYFASDTSGEKSFEEFYTEEEALDMTSFQALGVIKNAQRMDLKEIKQLMERLRNLFASDRLQKRSIVETVKEFIPNFEHIETGKNLDQKM